jgi:acetyltransferase-like isoleucine patch superfamily enzyme
VSQSNAHPIQQGDSQRGNNGTNNGTNERQRSIKQSLTARRQPLAKTLREMMVRTWVRSMVQLSAVAPFCLRLAELPLGPYKDKRILLRYLGDRPYISPLAQVSCANLQLGPKCFIDDFVTIYAHPQAQGAIHLERNVHLYRWSIIELGNGSGTLRIGANTYLQAGCVLNPFISNITIGANCMIATRCVFMPYQHGHADPNLPMREQPLTSRGDIVIEDDVWLGAQVCVMDGVVIGKGAIVGAGAVVTKDVPPNTLAVGVPARVIRQRHEDKPSPALMGLPDIISNIAALSQERLGEGL